jgi:hypothetical protein
VTDPPAPVIVFAFDRDDTVDVGPQEAIRGRDGELYETIGERSDEKCFED